MFIFLAIMGLGALIGYGLRHKEGVRRVPQLIHAIICFLLFLLGISVGLNRMIMDHLSYFCGQAAVISFMSIVGSMSVSMLLYHLCFKEKGTDEK